MKAIVQEGYGSPQVVKLREIELPAAGDDGVLVEVHAASVNALDGHLVRASRSSFGSSRPSATRSTGSAASIWPAA
jgi:NADPH:quinone reductase-like Zn-dependent oxidoreductase